MFCELPAATLHQRCADSEILSLRQLAEINC